MGRSRSRRARHARRRARRVAAADNDLSDADWAALLSAWDTSCAYCGATDVALTKDCVQAISRGGRYTLDNVVPACASCNASKGNLEVTSWLRRGRKPTHDERSFLLRRAEVASALLAARDATGT